MFARAERNMWGAVILAILAGYAVVFAAFFALEGFNPAAGGVVFLVGLVVANLIVFACVRRFTSTRYWGLIALAGSTLLPYFILWAIGITLMTLGGGI